LRPPGNGTDQIYKTAKGLLRDWLAEYPGARVRLLGVGGSELVKDAQPDLFAADVSAGGLQLDQTVDSIRDRFGDLSLGRARTMDRDQIR
jgi:hypothetical protein